MASKNTPFNSGEVTILKSIINEVFNVDLELRSRKQEILLARYAYIKILREFNYSSPDIGRSISKGHATVLHIEKNFKATADCYPAMFTMYLRCKELFIKWKGEPAIPLTTKFEAEIYLLKEKVKELQEDRIRLSRLVDRTSRIQDISNMLVARIPIGQEVKVGKEINKLLNGMKYDL
jgi:hypothetical protein